MRFSRKVERGIESLTCEELRGVMDHIMREIVDGERFAGDAE